MRRAVRNAVEDSRVEQVCGGGREGRGTCSRCRWKHVSETVTVRRRGWIEIRSVGNAIRIYAHKHGATKRARGKDEKRGELATKLRYERVVAPPSEVEEVRERRERTLERHALAVALRVLPLLFFEDGVGGLGPRMSCENRNIAFVQRRGRNAASSASAPTRNANGD